MMSYLTSVLDKAASLSGARISPLRLHFVPLREAKFIGFSCLFEGAVEGQAYPKLTLLIFCINAIIVVFPGGAIAGFLPMGRDSAAIFIEFPFEALRKAWSLPPYLPCAI